jgi:integrase
VAVIIKRQRQDGTRVYRVQDRTTGYPSFSESFLNHLDAKRCLAKVQADRQAGQAGIGRGNLTLTEAVQAFTETADFARRKSGRDTRRQLEWWTARMGRLPLGKITPDVIADNLHRLEVQGCSGSTVNRYRSALSRLFRYAVKTRRWIASNPCAGVERREEGSRRERVITGKEWRTLLAACDKLAAGAAPLSQAAQLRNYLRVLYGTAARRSEVLNLRWEYVDLDNGRLTFHNTKTGDPRTLPLIDDALVAIREQATLQREGNPWVFPSPFGDNQPVRLDRAFQAARKTAGLDTPDARGEMLVIHSLRHSAATEAGRNGASAFEVMALTGHKTLAMAHRYTKTGEEHALAAMNKRAGR